MHVKYDKFLNSKPKLFGIDIFSIYLIFGVWMFISYLPIDELIKLPLVAFFAIFMVFYNKYFNDHYFYFITKRKKFTKIIIENTYD